VKAKTWLSQKGIAYVEKSLNDPTIRQQFVERYPAVRTVPHIVVVENDGSEQVIGGYDRLVESGIETRLGVS
jgi:glutaredoxin